MIPFKEYESLQHDYLAKKEERNLMIAALEDLRQRNAPLENLKRQLEGQKSDMEKASYTVKEEINKAGQTLMEVEEKVKDLQEQDRTKQNELNGLEKKRREQQRELDKKKAILEKLVDELEPLRKQVYENGMINAQGEPLIQDEPRGRYAEIQKEEQELHTLLSSIQEQITAVRDRQTNLHNDASRCRQKLESKDMEIQRLNSVEGRKLDVLRNKAGPTFQAYTWLQQNQDKFKMPVIGPVCLVLNVKDTRYANAVETHMSMNVLTVWPLYCLYTS